MPHDNVSRHLSATLLCTKGIQVDVDPDEQKQRERTMLNKLRQGIELLHPEPDNLVSLASSLYVLRTLDGDLAQMTYDSLRDETVSVRSVGVLPRVMSFESETITFEFEINERDRSITGQVIPDIEGHIVLVHTAGEQMQQLDAVGSFHFGDIPAGPVRLRLASNGETIATTTSFTV